MFVPYTFTARSPDTAMPQACKPFSLQSNVCVGDLIAIVACSIAGIGFFFWAIHAIRKMRQFPFNYRQEDKGASSGQSERVDPYHVPSAFGNSLLVQQGVIQTPSPPERAQTRWALSEPEEDFYKQSMPTSYDPAENSMPGTPRRPPPAGGQSQMTSSHRSGRYGSLKRGAYGRDEYGVNDQYISPSPARVSPLYESGSGYGYRDT